MFNDRHQDFIDEITTRIRKAGAGSYRINVVRDKTAIPFDFFVYHCYLNSRGESLPDKDTHYPMYLELYSFNNKNHESNWRFLFDRFWLISPDSKWLISLGPNMRDSSGK